MKYHENFLSKIKYIHYVDFNADICDVYTLNGYVFDDVLRCICKNIYNSTFYFAKIYFTTIVNEQSSSQASEIT